MPASTVHTAVHDPLYSRVQLDLSGFASGTTSVQIIRRDLDTGRVALVRGARAVPIITPASDTIRLYDYEFPTGHSVEYAYYQFPDLTRYVFAAPATYDVTAAWLKHCTRPYLNTTVRVGKYDPFDHQLRGSAQPIVRRPVPIGGGDVRGGRRFSLTLKLTAAERTRLDDLLEVGGVWLWHKPGADVGLPPSCYVQATGARERIRGRPQDGDRWLDLTLDEVAPPDADLVAAAVTWDTIEATHASWDALLAAHASWNDVLATVAAPVEVTVP